MGLYTIRCKRPSGRYRAGKRFDREPDVYDLTDEQIAMVRADPFLVIEDDPKPETVTVDPSTEPEYIPSTSRRAKR